MILQFLPSDKRAAAGDTHPGIDDDKTRLPVGKLRTDYGQGLRAHCVSGVRHAIGEQYEGIGCAEVLGQDPPRPVRVTDERFRKYRPIVPDPSELALQRSLHVEANTIHVDVKLVLRPVENRVDREAYRGTRQRSPQRPFHIAALAPGGGEVIRRARHKQLGAFNSAYKDRRQQQILCHAHYIF